MTQTFKLVPQRFGPPALTSFILEATRSSGGFVQVFGVTIPQILCLRSHLPSPTVVNLQQAFKSHEDWVPVMPPSDGFTDISVDRHEYQVWLT